MPKILTVCLLLALAACGTRGPLYIPPGQPPEPLLGGKPTPLNQASTKKNGQNVPANPATPAENTSTDKKATNQ